MTVDEARNAYFRQVEAMELPGAVEAEGGCVEIDVLGVRLGAFAVDPAFKSGYLRFETGRYDGKGGFVRVPPVPYYSPWQINYPKPDGLLAYDSRSTYVYYTPVTRRIWAVRQADYVQRQCCSEAFAKGVREYLANVMRESAKGRPVEVSAMLTAYAEHYLIETTAVYGPLAPKGVSL